MKASDIFKVLNKGKRADTFLPQKKVKDKTLTVELKKYTGRKTESKHTEVIKGLKESLHIIFAPVQHFTKKMLEGVSKDELIQKVIHDKPTDNKKEGRGVSHTSKEGEFVNWFDLENTSEKQENKEKRITLLKDDGTVVGLDNMYNDSVYQ